MGPRSGLWPWWLCALFGLTALGATVYLVLVADWLFAMIGAACVVLWGRRTIEAAEDIQRRDPRG